MVVVVVVVVVVVAEAAVAVAVAAIAVADVQRSVAVGVGGAKVLEHVVVVAIETVAAVERIQIHMIALRATLGTFVLLRPEVIREGIQPHA